MFVAALPSRAEALGKPHAFLRETSLSSRSNAAQGLNSIPSTALMPCQRHGRVPAYNWETAMLSSSRALAVWTRTAIVAALFAAIILPMTWGAI